MLATGTARAASAARAALRGYVPRRALSSALVDARFVEFQLYEVLDVEEQVFTAPRFAHVTREVVADALGTATRLAGDKFAPHMAISDAQEPRFVPPAGVEMPAEVGDALLAFRDAGLLSAHADFEFGGMQLPSVVVNALYLPLYVANTSTMTFVFLTVAAGNMLAAAGSPDQVQRFLPPMLDGTSTGTMNLSEPHAGSSLGDVTTKAIPLGDGRYSIKGTKMWISGGEIPEPALGPFQTVTHMVLAKVVDPAAPDRTPAGVKGISLFLVPKYRPSADGSLGTERNGVELAGLNHKMGWRGIPNTVLNFGENGECVGELVGAEGQGLATMFLMMNEARITIGLTAAAFGYAGYARSLEYAKERRQGRPLSNKDPAAEQVPIVEHADVRRMLLAQKAYTEGALALIMRGSVLVDKLADPTGMDETAQQDAALLLDTLTPIIKSWPSEWCLEANKWAIQVHGGYGYTRDYGVEQIYRDNRLNMIHEGTNGIQSMDLLGRKVGAARGRGLQVLLDAMSATEASARAFADQHPGSPRSAQLGAHCDALASAARRLEETTLVLRAASRPELGLANSHEYLNMAGHTVIAWQWLAMELAAARAMEDAPPAAEQTFYQGKLHTSRFFFRYELPKTVAQADMLKSLDDTTLDMDPEWL